MIQLKIIEILKNRINKCENISAMILYGSFARKEANVNSDIDLAILVNGKFESNQLIIQLREYLQGFKVIEILYIKLRKKIVVYFDDIPKIEIALLNNIEEIKRNYLGSGIPSDFIDTTILFDKTSNVKPFLSNLSKLPQNNNRDIKEIAEDLIDKFVYEFESCSYNHFRSDGYKFYYFYNIAFHIAVQLRYLADDKTRYYFLPKNFLVKNMIEPEQKEAFYKLAGSTFLRDANDKKRKLLDFFNLSLEKLKFDKKENIINLTEKIYKRDFLWNFRDISKFNPVAKSGIIFRTSSLTSYQNENFIYEFLSKNNIKTIIDLRAQNEIEGDSYNLDFIKDFNYIKAPFDPWNQPEWFKETEHYGTNIEIAYRFFVKACKNEVKKVFNAIFDSDGAIAIHCFAGKDRTGFIIMLINMLIETPYDIMLNDYLASELDTAEDKFRIFYNNILNEGGIVEYLKSCGLTENKLNSIKDKLSK